MEGSCDLELGLRLAGASYHDADDRGRLEAATVSGRAQREHLTIIYKGEVCFYENVSEVQARAIMLLAGGGERLPRLSRVNTFKELNLTKNLPATRPKSCEGAPSVLPPIERCSTAASALMMKRSLQRFLQKRKLRMQKSSASPY